MVPKSLIKLVRKSHRSPNKRSQLNTDRSGTKSTTNLPDIGAKHVLTSESDESGIYKDHKLINTDSLKTGLNGQKFTLSTNRGYRNV